jgi:hypothetical protein
MNFIKIILHHTRTVGLMSLIMLSTLSLYAQTGTYEKKNANGAYCIISYQQSGNEVMAEIFAWWNSFNSKTGGYYGKGTLKNNQVLLRSEENDPGCKVMLKYVKGKIEASYTGCTTENLTEDFNGSYTKISDAVAGEYLVTVPKAYFYKSPGVGKRNAYVVKGDKVRLDIDRIGASNKNWLFVYFPDPKGKDTPGFISASELRRIE